MLQLHAAARGRRASETDVMLSTLSQLFQQRIKWAKQKLLLRGQRWTGKSSLAMQWLIVFHSQRRAWTWGADWWCMSSRCSGVFSRGCCLYWHCKAGRTSSDQARPCAELLGSAFSHADNCLNSLPPFEANEELAKACLWQESTGLRLGCMSRWWESQQSHRTCWSSLFQVHEEWSVLVYKGERLEKYKEVLFSDQKLKLHLKYIPLDCCVVALQWCITSSVIT